MWRWRPNPLRRRSDLVEAWAGLAAVAVAAVGAPAAGIAAGRAVDASLRHAAAAQRAQRHEVRAVVLDTKRRRSGPVSPDDGADQATAHSARISWTGLDGRPQYADVTIIGRHSAGTTIPLWVDNRHDKPTDPPMDTATATSNAVAAGVGAAAALAALVMAARSFVAWRLLRRRLAAWERDWSRVSQHWAGAGG